MKKLISIIVAFVIVLSCFSAMAMSASQVQIESLMKALSIMNGDENGNLKSGGAFKDCTNLKSIYLMGGTQTIGDYAFSGTGITSVVIPKSATLIRPNAFDSHVEYLVYKDSPMAKIAAAEAIHPYKFID